MTVTATPSHNTAPTHLDAQIRIYREAAHGFLFQHPTEVAAAVNEFLTTDDDPGSTR